MAGTVLDVSLAKPSVDRPPPMQRQDHHTYATRGGLLPQYTQRGYSRDGGGGGGGGGGGYGHNPRLPPAYGDYTAQSDVVKAVLSHLSFIGCCDEKNCPK